MPVYSNEIQDIMGKIPGRVLRIGASIIMSILIALLIGSYLFKLPETVKCPIILTTINPPAELYSKQTGQIKYIFVKEQQYVHKYQTIAYIDNSAIYENVELLRSLVSSLENIVTWDSVVLNQKIEYKLILGEIQNSYIQFCKSWSNFRHYLNINYLPQKIHLVKKQLVKKHKDLQELHEQHTLHLHDLQLAHSLYKRDSSFYMKHSEAMSVVDFEKKTQEYIQKQTDYMNFCLVLRNAENEIDKLSETLLDLEVQHEQEYHSYQLELDEAFRTLKEQYKQWKAKYLFETPISGHVTFTGYWSENQAIKEGERLATIVPLNDTKIIGRAFVDMSGIGKIRVGQNVNIKLAGFPYMEFGMIKGKVKNISLVPEKDKGYVAEIELTKGMLSSYKQKLNFIQESEGMAEIITKDRRLLSRLISPLKSLLNN